MKFFCLNPRFWIKGWIFITSNVYVCICVLSMSVYVYVVSMCDLGSLWTKGTWMIWEVRKWLWGSANDLIVCDYECWANMNDNEWMWALNKHKWLWTTMNMNKHEWLWDYWTIFVSGLRMWTRSDMWVRAKNNMWMKARNDLRVSVRNN